MARERKRILLLCATRRGASFARRLFALYPEGDYTVVTFRPEPWEPDYLPALEAATVEAGARLVLAKKVDPDALFDDGAFDLLLAVSWRYLVSRDVWSRATLGAYVFHDSLLPRYRGFSPTIWAMINGEPCTGVSLIEMADAVDSGRLIDQERVEIGPEEYVASVLERVTAVYVLVLERCLPALLAGAAARRVQNEAEATYFGKRRPEDNRIDWSASARRVFDLVRACAAPYPGAFCFRGDQRVTVWACDPPVEEPVGEVGMAGMVMQVAPGAGVRVSAGAGSLWLREVQVAGGLVTRADLVFGSEGERLR